MTRGYAPHSDSAPADANPHTVACVHHHPTSGHIRTRPPPTRPTPTPTPSRAYTTTPQAATYARDRHGPDCGHGRCSDPAPVGDDVVLGPGLRRGARLRLVPVG